MTPFSALTLLCAFSFAATEPGEAPPVERAAPLAGASVDGGAPAVEVSLVPAAVPGAPVPAATPETPAEDSSWLHGDHFTGEWGGARTWLGDHGVTVDLNYAAELFSNLSRVTSGQAGTNLLGHVDLGLTLDTGKLGLWQGGRLYVLGQNNHLYTPTRDPTSTGINEFVGSSQPVSNLEVAPMSQLGELFYEQAIGGRVTLRFGKQDANRDFGTPRFGGNFMNNNFGMFPNSPLPSFPTNGLGGVAIVEPVDGLVARVGVYEGQPQVGSLGFDSALKPGAGFAVIGSGAWRHTYGADHRNGGTTSVGVWRQTGTFPELGDAATPRTFDSAVGFFIQNDEKLFSHPANPESIAGWNLITRVSWAQPDRYLNGLFASASLAYHGLGSRGDDTIGIGGGVMTVGQQLGGAPGVGTELFVEAFYKARLTKFFSVQPDVQIYSRPGGDGPLAFAPGVRLKFKL